MSRLNLPPRNEGHRFQNLPNNDLDQKLTYQQLLEINHYLSIDNKILKNTANRLSKELSNLHIQFGIEQTEENVELYNAIGAHPILYQYANILIPLFNEYQHEIQDFQKKFQTVHEEFFTLEKKFEEVCQQNEELKSKTMDLIKQLMDVYKNGGNQKMKSNFGNIILEQIKQKQKVLVEENARLERDYQKYKAESERANNELDSVQKMLDQLKNRLKEAEISVEQLKIENVRLKESSFELQIKVNQTQAQKRKLEQGNQRAQSQNNLLNKEKEMYRNRLEELKARIERDTSIPTENDQGKLIEQLQTKIAFLQAEQGPNDYHKKLSKLQKDYDALLKQKQRLKEALDSSKIREDELNQTIVELKGQISKVSTQKSILERNESKVNKSLQTLAQKSKNDLLKAKKQAQEEIQKIQFELKHKIQMKDKKIAQLDEALDRIKLEKDRIEKQNQIYGRDSKQPKPTKDSERALNKMKQKMIISQDLFKEQLQIFENDLAYMRKEADTQRKQCQDKTQELNKLKAEHDHLRKLYEQIYRQKQTLVNEFKRVRNQYQDHLRVKQQNFEEKIKEIRVIVQESDNKRRIERQRVQQATRQYKRVLEDIKNAYEARIRELENQVNQVQYVRTDITSGY